MLRPPDKGAASLGERGVAVPLTIHARARMQQRGIRPDALEALLDYGRALHLHSKGRELVFLDKPARAHLRLQLPSSSRRGGAKRRGGGIYAVLGSDGTVITVGHRYRRVTRA